MGGSPLEGQALAIYNSMNAYGLYRSRDSDALQARLYTHQVQDNTDTFTPVIIRLSRWWNGGNNQLDPMQRTF